LEIKNHATSIGKNVTRIEFKNFKKVVTSKLDSEIFLKEWQSVNQTVNEEMNLFKKDLANFKIGFESDQITLAKTVE
jgi:hypothetical protein